MLGAIVQLASWVVLLASHHSRFTSSTATFRYVSSCSLNPIIVHAVPFFDSFCVGLEFSFQYAAHLRRVLRAAGSRPLFCSQSSRGGGKTWLGWELSIRITPSLRGTTH